MRLPKIISRRRLKWTGLAATFLFAAATIESDAFWPSFSRSLKPPSVMWQARVVPGGVVLSKIWFSTSPPTVDNTRFAFDSRIAFEERYSRFTEGDLWKPAPYAWLLSYQTIGNEPRVSRYLVIPFWLPLVLFALPTSVLFYRDRKPMPGFCAKCRYDLAGLTSDTCPKCGSTVATIASISGRANDDTMNRRSGNRLKCASRVKAKLLKIITSRRSMWTGLAIIACLIPSLVASYWLWPSYSWGKSQSPVSWCIGVRPGGVYAQRNEPNDLVFVESLSGVKLESRSATKDEPNYWWYWRYGHDTPIQWLSRLWFLVMGGHGSQSLHVAFWVPLSLCAVPTGILVFLYHKRKPGCCTKCGYDLTGLSGDTCPECGTKIATTDSHKAAASAAEGESDAAGGENGDCLGENGVT